MNKTEENEIRIDTWSDLLTYLFKHKDLSLDRFRSNYVYRGIHNKDYGLETSIQRMGRKPSDLEQHLIRNFKKYAPINTLSGEYDNIWNWIALGQHYGLPTRFLDWSFSPLVALHFMADFEKGFDSDGAIWMVDFVKMRDMMPENLNKKIVAGNHLAFTAKELSEEVGNTTVEIMEFQKENDKDYLMFMEPPSIDDRIVNQFALFSFMLNPDSDKLTYLTEHPDLYKKLIIPAELKWEIRDKLDQANISERIIYPGLDGIARWLKRWYSEKSPEKKWSVNTNNQELP